MDVKLDESWKEALKDEFEKPYFKELAEFVRQEYMTKTVYPPPKLVFNALNMTPFDEVKVVILGQDPYHGAGQAMGLCFSVPEGVPKPPSLRNIFKEVQNDLWEPVPESGDLTHWAEQGVLLVNATLTVEAGKAGSHQNKGWEEFTDAVIRTLSEKRDSLVFMLWGAYARKKKELIDTSRHLVLEAPHPSPLSAHNGFFGCGHFSKAGQWLKEHGKEEISWVRSDASP